MRHRRIATTWKPSGSCALLRTPQAREALLAQGPDIEASTPAALAARISSDLEKWRSVIANAGIKAE